MEMNELLEAMKSLASAMNMQAVSYRISAERQSEAGNTEAAAPYEFAANAWTDACKGIMDLAKMAEAK
jgi:hypothetical protein